MDLPFGGIFFRKIPRGADMVIIVKVKNTDNIIGLKEDIAMRLEGVVDIERIEVSDLDTFHYTVTEKGETPCKT